MDSAGTRRCGGDLILRAGGLFAPLSIAALAPALAAAAPAPSSRLDRAAALEISRDARADRDRAAPLQPRGDGGYDYADPRRRFHATISADGRVTFEPARNIEPTLCLMGSACVELRELGEHLADPGRWQARPTANQAGAALHGLPDLSIAHPGNYSLGSEPWSGLPTPIMFGVGARFGPPLLTDRVRAEFLKETFELRVRLAAKAERARLSAALSVLEDKLMKVWGDRRTPLAERRKLLFELWDECLDELPPPPVGAPDDLAAPLEELRHRAAAEGRRRIILFIRARAPRGSEAAYTDEELRRLNARRQSAEPFAPYADAAP